MCNEKSLSSHVKRLSDVPIDGVTLFLFFERPEDHHGGPTRELPIAFKKSYGRYSERQVREASKDDSGTTEWTGEVVILENEDELFVHLL
tara:strand:- start:4562 stop:4831 length:270 start_codon:yes stop_codon:yes gene_type:complete